MCKDCGMKFTCLEFFKSHLHQHALGEEEEEAQTGENGNPVAEMLSGRDLDQGGDGDWCDMSSSSQTKPSGLIQGVAVGKTSMKKKLRKAFACLVCGKIYTYLVSFRKHQQLHENKSPEPKSVSLHKYECPECGMSFIRQARLLGHMRIHRPPEPPESNAPRCNQCNRYFRSIESWMAHVDQHKQKPFWCLSCTKGFKDEELLDRHLQNHSRKKYECNICHKSFLMSTQLTNHYKIHGRSKPFQCSFCMMSFSNPRKLVSHRKKHLRVYVGSSGMPLGIKNSANRKKQRIKRKRFFLTSVKEEPEMERCSEILPGMEAGVITSEPKCEDAEFGDQANSEESDCGEPLHHFKLSKSSGLPGSDPADEAKAESVRAQTGPQFDGSETQETNMHREHKYWEWECIECDMGFDDVAELHLHYIKHATGELPLPQGDTEG